MMSDQARKQRIKKALKGHGPDGERLHLQYQGRYIDCPVVNLPREAVVYNPRSHRIQAQLESEGHAAAVESDPWSEASQKIIERTLQGTLEYGDLRDNLALEGQRDAGVITEAGVMINGNTRAAAMAELGEKYIRVAVLPPDAGEQEIDDLELQLQVAKDFRQAYTFTNKLLFINELAIRHDRSHGDIARSLGLIRNNERRELERAEAEVQQSLRLLALIRELQSLAPDGELKLTAFDENEQALREIDIKFEGSRATDEPTALTVRNARLLGVLCELGYRELREIQDRFVDDYFVHSLGESDLLCGVADDLLVPASASDADDLPGLDMLDSTSHPSTDLSPLLDLVLGSAGEQTVRVGNETIEREAFLGALNEAMDDAAHEAKTDRKATDRIHAPVRFMRDAGRDLTRSLAAFQKVEDEPGFDDASFDDAVRHAHGVLVSIADRAGIVLEG
jgi:hypothetical protein